MKTITELARDAGIRDVICDGTRGCLKRLAEIVRADEREACAKLVHDNALACDPGSMLQTYLASNAAAIRARSNT